MAHAKFTLFFFFFLFLAISVSPERLKFEAHNQSNTISSSGLRSVVVEGIHDKLTDQPHFIHEVGMASKSRKLLEDEVLQPDYDYAGPNPKHDPKKGKGGKSL